MDIDTFTQLFLKEFVTLVKAPFSHPNMLWITTPLLVVLLLMTFYFGKYVREKLGWNTALGNSIVLLFVGMDLLRTIYNYPPEPAFYNFIIDPVKTLLIIIVMMEGVLLSFAAFQHAISEKIMFFIASPLPVNLQAYVLTAIIYLNLRPSWFTLLAALMLFLAMYIVLHVLQGFEHRAYGYQFNGAKKLE